jgi:hypothetical protein
LGFLRRALDKFTLLYPVLVAHVQAGRAVSPPLTLTLTLTLVSAVLLLLLVLAYTNPLSSPSCASQYAINLARRDAPELPSEHRGHSDDNLPYLAATQATKEPQHLDPDAPHPSADPAVSSRRKGSDGTLGSVLPALSDEQAYEMLECESCLVRTLLLPPLLTLLLLYW